MIPRFVEVKMDAKRRLSVPSQLLDEAGIPATSRLIAHMEAPGRFVIETPEAAVAAAGARIWASFDAVETDRDATADVRAMRDDDNVISDTNAAARSDHSAAAVEEAGRHLLAALGLNQA